MTKWFVVLGAVLLQICLGAIYTWSLFNQPLVDKFGWQLSEVALTFSITIFVFAFTTIISGKMQDKFGPRIVATIGGLVLGTGLILASKATTVTQLYLFYGVLGGAGVGIAYVCPLSTCVKWFPENRGFITGIAVGAFGLGSLVFKGIIVNLLATKGVSETFFYLGIIFAVLVVAGAQLLKVPATSEASSGKASASSDSDFTSSEMLKTKSFYLLWITYFFACISGLLVIGLAKDIGVEMAGLEPVVAANAVAVLALFNAGGRLSWGVISDKLGRVKSILVMFIMTAVSMAALAVVPLTYFIFFGLLAIIAFCFGGFLSVYPVITADFFGTKNLGGNYGLIFIAYGFAAMAGPQIKNASTLTMAFIIAAGCAALSAGLMLMVKKPVKDVASAEQVA
jgi:OFA family oxalate/formate antiporter-like MFS transporter